MPYITGTVQDIGGNKMGSKAVELIFVPNEPLLGVASPRIGFVYPTEPVIVTPEADGTFSALLGDTTVMHVDTYYLLRIRWLGADAGGALMDFPHWKIRPGSSDATLADITEISGTPNQKIWWVSLSAPPSTNYLWLHTNPDDYDDSRNTGDVREWR